MACPLRDPADFRSLLSDHWMRILVGVAAGYVAQRLWSNSHAQDIAKPKLAELHKAPTIPISSLNQVPIPEPAKQGDLALIQHGVVTPLSSIPYAKRLVNKGDIDHLYSSRTGEEVVVKKTVEYTDQPKEFEDVFKGMRHVNVSRVPFAITDPFSKTGAGPFVVVKNVDPDQLPLTHDWTTKSELDPAVTLTRNFVKKYDESVNKNSYEERVATNVVHVKKVMEESLLKADSKLENVFGILRFREGVAEIEPSPGFFKKCFLMNRSEIEREIQVEAEEDVFPMRFCSVLFWLVSFGLFFSALYYSRSSYSSSLICEL